MGCCDKSREGAPPPLKMMARLPEWIILPLRVLLLAGLLISALYVVRRLSAGEEVLLTQVFLLILQVVISVTILAECARSSAVYKAIRKADQQRAQLDQ